MTDHTTAAQDLGTSAGGRAYLAEYFATQLRRHDFTRYIENTLAADFACALAQHLSKLRALVADERAADNHFEDELERAYWEMDARIKGLGKHKGRPQPDRDAFKWAVRGMRPTLPKPAPEYICGCCDVPRNECDCAALASAPVAGEAQNSDSRYAAKSSTYDAARIVKLPTVDAALAAFIENSDGNTALALVQAILDAAPQASEAVLPAPCHDLRYHDQYRIGWNRCLDECRAALSAQPGAQKETNDAE